MDNYETEHPNLSPTRSAQEVLRRMSLNSPPSRSDNPRQVKRVKLLRGIGVGPGSSGFHPSATDAVLTAPQGRFAPPPSQTPMKAAMPKRVPPLYAPSPMPTWGPEGVNLRDASAGEVLEASDPSSFYPSSFGGSLASLRQPYGNDENDGNSTAGKGNDNGLASSPCSSSATMIDDDDEEIDDASLLERGEDYGSAPLRLVMDDGECFTNGFSSGNGKARRAGGRDKESGIDSSIAVPGTPLRRPGSGARRRFEQGLRDGGSCSPVGGFSGAESAAQGSPVKKKNVGRLRLSGDLVGSGGPAFELSPPRASINPFSPNLAGDGSSRGRSTMRDFSGDRLQDDMLASSMPAPAPRSRLASSNAPNGIGNSSSPMETGDGVTVDPLAVTPRLHDGSGGTKGGEDGSFLRRVSPGSCVSLSDAGGGPIGKSLHDAANPSPCDVTAFVPFTPTGLNGSPSGMSEAGSGMVDRAPMSPDFAGGRVGVGVCMGEANKRGRFVTDFEELDVIGSGGFGTVYKVRSRVDGCLYAVKCTRRRFKGEADRKNMLKEVYALAAVCDAQDTTNIVRYHQAWIEDERLYIQTELCETSLEKQLESGRLLEFLDLYAFLRQSLLGLDILHRHNLVHLDIKPGNIFVKNGRYKLGDFGLVTPVTVVGPGADVEEGDSRYMSMELLNDDDHSDLTKCDVFSLGITLYEIVSRRPLPPNGEEWHRLRSGKAGMPMGLPKDLSQALQQMMHPDPTKRPSAAELLRFPSLQSELERQLNVQKSELNKERTHNQALKLEVSALIQKQSQRSGRPSRTITWDNSYFSKSDPGPLFSTYDGSRAFNKSPGYGQPFNPIIPDPASASKAIGRAPTLAAMGEGSFNSRVLVGGASAPLLFGSTAGSSLHSGAVTAAGGRGGQGLVPLPGKGPGE